MKKIMINCLFILLILSMGISFADGYTPIDGGGYGVYTSEDMTVYYDPDMVTIQNHYLDQTTYVYIIETIEETSLGKKVKAAVTVSDGKVYDNVEAFIYHPYKNGVKTSSIKILVDFPVEKGLETITYTQEYQVSKIKSTEAPYVNVHWNVQEYDVLGEYAFDFDVMPQTIEGRTMVPLRAIFEALGYTVSWDDKTGTATCKNAFNEMKVTIGQKSIGLKDLASGEFVTIESDMSPMILNGRTMVPLRVISEASGLSVAWDGSHRIVYLDGDQPGQALDLSVFSEVTLAEEDVIPLETVKVSPIETSDIPLYPFSVKDSAKYYVGYMDEHGNVVVDAKYTSDPLFVEGYATPDKDVTEGAAIIDEKGKEYLVGPYDIQPISQESFAVTLEEYNMSTHVNVKGQRLYEAYYDSVESFMGNLAKVRDGKSTFVIDKDGKEYLRDSLYDVATTTDKDYLVVATDKFQRESGITGIVDLNGKPFIPLMFVTCEATDEGFRGFYEDRYLYFDMSGQIIEVEENNPDVIYEDEKVMLYYSKKSDDGIEVTLENIYAKKEQVFEGDSLEFHEVYDGKVYMTMHSLNANGKASYSMYSIDVDTLKVIKAEEDYVSYLMNGFFKVDMTSKSYYGIGHIDSDVIKPSMAVSAFEYQPDEDDE